MRNSNQNLKNIRSKMTLGSVNTVRAMIVYFSQVRVYDDNTFAILGNEGSWLEHYIDQYNKNRYVVLSYAEAKQYQDRNYFLIEGNPGEMVFEQTRTTRNVFKYGQDISIVERHDTYIDIFDFAGRVNDQQMTNFYINNRGYLKGFIEDFREQGTKLINTVLAPASLSDAYSLCGRKRNIFESCLSAREMSCLRLMAMGKTMKQVGQTLNLSSRTIESYLNSAKVKMHCLTLPQLIDLFWKNHYICSTD